MMKNVWMIIIFALISAEGAAQIIDLQNEINKKVEEPGLTIGVAGTWDRRSGNTDLSTSSFSGMVRYRHHTPETVFLIYHQEKGDKSGDKYLDNTLLHGRYRWEFSRFVSWEMMGQTDSNKFRGYRVRNLAGTGPLLKWVDKKTHIFYTGLIYMKEYEVLTSKEADNDWERRDAERWSLSVLYNEQWGKRVSANLSAYYQPDVYHRHRHRTAANLGVDFDIEKNLSYFISVTHTTNTNPPVGVEKIDQRYHNGLKLVF